jgi:hypothetical protein
MPMPAHRRDPRGMDSLALGIRRTAPASSDYFPSSYGRLGKVLIPEEHAKAGRAKQFTWGKRWAFRQNSTGEPFVKLVGSSGTILEPGSKPPREKPPPFWAHFPIDEKGRFRQAACPPQDMFSRMPDASKLRAFAALLFTRAYHCDL